MDHTPQQKAYLDYQMKKVSRSFALVVSYLEEPLQQQMAAAYLICRVLDNIEDCGQPFWWKEKRFSEFLTLLDEPEKAAETLKGWELEPWPLLSNDEQLLMGCKGGEVLWQIFAQFPIPARLSIKRWAAEMTNGMRQMANPEQVAQMRQIQGALLLSGLDDYNAYCYFVAGTVGHLATELAIQFYEFDEPTASKLLATCEACGRGLQKTNIVKDFEKDLRRGVSYLPDQWLKEIDYTPLHLSGAPIEWTQMVIADVVQELHEAVKYVLALPASAKGYRLASLMCLLPAYETLALGARRHEKLFTADHQYKVSRMTMMKCYISSRAMISDNDAIQKMSDHFQKEIFAAFGKDGYMLQTSLNNAS